MYKMHILYMNILGDLCVILEPPEERRKQSLPLCSVVNPLGD